MHDKDSGAYLGTIKPSLHGFGGGGGQVDITHGMTAYLRSNGEYILFTEDAGHNLVIITRWCPSGDCPSPRQKLKVKRGQAEIESSRPTDARGFASHQSAPLSASVRWIARSLEIVSDRTNLKSGKGLHSVLFGPDTLFLVQSDIS